jgi:Cdc6-like AAA superfamily ATPase
MKNLMFICGSNGIGKTTICKTLLKRLSKSAYVDSDPCRMMNPFVLNDETIPTISKNLSDMIKNYFDCPAVETVIFSYGFHGRRKEVFDSLVYSLSKYEYNFIPFLLICDEAENIRRMNCDGRDIEQIKRALEVSRNAFSNINYPTINITMLTASEAATKILDIANLDFR